MLLAEDPKNEQYQLDLAVVLQRFADALFAANQPEEAKQVTDRALKFLRPIVDTPGASFDQTYQFCWILLTTPFKELQDPAAAKHYAENLAQITQGKDPGTLDLLARAYFGSGETAKAVETEAKAVSLLPANADTELRKELTENLSKFRTRAEGKKTN
jgi:tetratricopeptide (TPR) repeat protein